MTGNPSNSHGNSIDEGADPASAEARDAADGNPGREAPVSEEASFAQLGVVGGEPVAQPQNAQAEDPEPQIGAAEALPPDKALELNEIAADDVGATNMAERASEKDRGTEKPS